MMLRWVVTRRDVSALRAFLAAQAEDPFVIMRRQRNLASKKRKVSRAAFWHELAAALLTTQQRSGPNSSVGRLLRARPFPLAYALLSRAADPETIALQALRSWGGIRRGPTIARQLAQNLRELELGSWADILGAVNGLRKNRRRDREREVADLLAERLEGLGPKQSRNLLQGLGLTRYEVPIDSRLTRWLNEFGFPVKLSAAALSDPNYYRFVSSGFQELCKAAGAYPCVVDAAIFASYDRGQWTAGTVVGYY